ncbi:MAG: Lrp/AsnC family transcriptional regulator [Chloroflexota bacterium]
MVNNLDSVDLQIISALRRDGRTSNTDLAKRLFLSEGAVRKRIRRLLKNNLVKITAVCHPASLGCNSFAIVGIRARPASLKSIAAKLSSLEAVRYLSYTAGAFDLLIEVWFPTNEDLHDFLRETLMTISGVEKVEPTVILKVLKSAYEWTESEPGVNTGERLLSSAGERVLVQSSSESS